MRSANLSSKYASFTTIQEENTMKYKSFLAVGGLIATMLLTACSSVRLSEAPVEDRSGVAAG